MKALQLPHEIVYMNTSRIKYLNPIRNIVQAGAILKRHPVDLIHCHGYRADLIGMVQASRLGLPAVATCHGYIANDQRLKLYNRLDVRVLRRFSRVMAVSHLMKEQLVDQGVDSSRIDVVVNAVDDVHPVVVPGRSQRRPRAAWHHRPRRRLFLWS